jgi:hypothetical protein
LLGFIDDAWMHELTKTTPDWNGAIASMEEALRAGERWNLPVLTMIAARGIAAVQDEYLRQKDKALKTLADAAVTAGTNGVILRYQKGMIHFLHKEYAEAYDAWISTLDEWPSDSEEAAVYAFFAISNCGAAAAFLDRWDVAAGLFHRGRDLALKVNRQLDALKFRVDAAYATWRAGRRRDAITYLSQVLTDMEQLAKTDQSSEFHTQWKVMEHVIRWCAVDAGAPTKAGVVAPRPGIASEAKSKEKHELVKNAPRASPLLSWYSLAEAELYAETGRAAFGATLARTDVNDSPAIRSMIEFLTVRRALADGEFESIPLMAETAASTLSSIDVNSLDERTMSPRGAQATPSPEASSQAVSFIEESILCALLWMAERDVDWERVIDQWKGVLPRLQYPHILSTVIEGIGRISKLTPREAYAEYSSARETRFNRVVAALRMVVHTDSPLGMRHVGLCTLVTDEGFATNLTLSHKALASLTRKVWLNCVANPFELLSPRLTVPAIQSACNSGRHGLALAAAILLAAGEAVRITKSSNMQRRLRELVNA